MNWQLENRQLLINGVRLEPSSVRPLSEMTAVLQTPESVGPDPLYRVYRGVTNESAPDGARSDITILEPGVLGKEFTKTHGHYHLGEGEETYELLSGNGSLLLQQPGFNFESVDSVRFVNLRGGQPVIIPSGWGHTMINCGEEPLLTLNYQPGGVESLYAPFDKKRGAAYYVVKGPQGTEFEANPNYGAVPKIQTF